LLQANALHLLLVQVLLPGLLLQTAALHLLQLQMVLSGLLLQAVSMLVLPEVLLCWLRPRDTLAAMLQRTGARGAAAEPGVSNIASEIELLF
jgi:hypothetical protein